MCGGSNYRELKDLSSEKIKQELDRRKAYRQEKAKRSISVIAKTDIEDATDEQLEVYLKHRQRSKK